MARLIDADKFGMYLADVQLANRGWRDDVCELLDDVMYALEDAPTIDAVEVVRCKDCKSRGTENCAMTFNTEDNGYYLTDWTSDDGFCSWGKRKEE